MLFQKKKIGEAPELNPQKTKKTKTGKEVSQPQYYRSMTGIETLNYNVYILSRTERILYNILAFAIGAGVGYLFFGGIGKDRFGDPTVITYAINTFVMVLGGIVAAKLYLPVRNEQLRVGRQKKLKSQFRDMLEAVTTSLSAGHNIRESFFAVYDDMRAQYDDSAYIIQELYVIRSGLNNNATIEELLNDFGTRSGCEDIADFANVFDICNQRGGNPRDIIRNTYEILSDKMEIAEEIETVVTGSKSEQYLMLVMPVLLIGMIKVSSPDFAANFVTLTGILSTLAALALFVVSYFIGRKVLDIKV